MNSIKKIVGLMMTLTLSAAFFGAGEIFLLPEAHAVVGRPVTPVSYAGVARRTTQRATYGGGAVGYGYGYSHSTNVYVDSDDDDYNDNYNDSYNDNYNDNYNDHYNDDDCYATVNAYGNIHERCED